MGFPLFFVVLVLVLDHSSAQSFEHEDEGRGQERKKTSMPMNPTPELPLVSPLLPGADDIWCVIPVFNNADTVAAVAAGCRRLLRRVLVVDDGSTDASVAGLLAGTDIVVLRHERNLGKGRALLTGLRRVEAEGGRFMITLDADGQHWPADIPAFVSALREDADSIVIGVRDFTAPNVPRSSRFGRAFSNFWVRLETGVSPGDSQSGFRAYPVKHLARLRLRGNRFDFETDVLVKASWAGLALKRAPIGVSYQPPDKRISHFRPGLDNLRIVLRHIALVGRRLIPWPHRKLARRPAGARST
ncbi:MAG: glycosyltransferase family 2 protein [Verrucomicrobiota bacterium]|nr:glycosyltransferase family 2 protein [Verrucomicrobiota bacterium]